MSQESRKLPYGDGRDALLSAVIDVAAEKGLRGVTYRAVATRAGVNHTLVSHHFGSLQGLLAATMEWAVERSIQATGLSGIAEFDEGFADSLIANVTAEPELQMFQFEMILQARRDPDIRAMVQKLYENYVRTVEEALQQQGFDTEGEISLAIFAALDGLMLQLLTIGNEKKIRAAVKLVGRLVSALRESIDALHLAGEATRA